MEYLIFSDSHRAADRIRAALARQVARPSGIFFLGDGVSDATDAVGDLPLYAVRGNCDGFLSPNDASPVERTVSVEGLRVLLMHGHLFSVKSGPGAAISYAARSGADVLLFGHTHEAYTEIVDAGESVGGITTKKPLLVCNPGSIGDGGSFVVLTVKDGIPHISLGTL